MYDVKVKIRNGDILEIAFASEDGTVGPFAKARSVAAGSPVAGGFTRVPADAIVDFLAGILNDRSDLRALPDFEGCTYDVDGNPKVWGVVVECSSCDNQWSHEMASVDRPIPCCQVCGSDGIVDEDTLAWIGPRNDTLQALWERLPLAIFAVSADDDMGAEGAIEVNGSTYVFTLKRP